jgi:hypothetical protein
MKDIHRQVLEQLCRLCGGQLRATGVADRQKSFRNVGVHSETLLRHFTIGVNEEDLMPTIYPRHLCNKCRVRLGRLEKKELPQNLEAYKSIPI